MKNLNAKKFTIIENEKYGPYLTINEVIIQGKKSIERRWNVIHCITGKTHIMRPAYLNTISKKYNDKLLKGDYQKGLKNYLYKNTIRGAQLRNHNFNLTFEEFLSLISQDCYYCGDPPMMVNNKILITRGNIHEPPITYNGIDRLNPDLGYFVENCVSSCSKCNYMKHVQQFDDFKEQILKIVKHLKIN